MTSALYFGGGCSRDTPASIPRDVCAKLKFGGVSLKSFALGTASNCF